MQSGETLQQARARVEDMIIRTLKGYPQGIEAASVINSISDRELTHNVTKEQFINLVVHKIEMEKLKTQRLNNEKL